MSAILSLLLVTAPVAAGAAAGEPAPAEAPQITVSSQVDKVRVAADEPLTFSVTIAGPLATLPRVTVPSFEGFQVISTGQSQSMSLHGGAPQLAITLEYLLVPAEAGKHTLGPVVVEHEGQTYQAAPIEVEVTPTVGDPAPQPEKPRRPPLRGGTVL